MLVLAHSSDNEITITYIRQVKRDVAELNEITNHCLKNTFPVHIIVHICASKGP